MVWGDVTTGDVVLGADARPWYVERDGWDFTLRRPDVGTPMRGRPSLTAPVLRLLPGHVSYVRKMFGEAGLDTEVIYERMT